MIRVKVSKTERLLNLISFMLRGRRPVPFSEIAGQVVGYDDDARLDSIEKRFDRDKAELRNMGIPVEYVDGGMPETSGYVIPRDKFFLGRVSLDSIDAVILKFAGQSGAIRFSGPLMKDAFNSALRKLSVDAPEIDDIPVEPASVLQVSSGNSRAPEILQVVCAAVYARRTISFKYTGRRDEKAEKRKVDPYGLGISKGEWYLVGYCHGREANRMFKLARIEGTVVLTGASDAGCEFEIPKGFRIDQHLQREAWDFGEGEPVDVRLELPHDVVAVLTNRTSLQIEDITPGAGVDPVDQVTVRARAPHRLLDWIISLGPAVRLLGPPDLVATMQQRLDALAGVYGEASA